MATRSKQIRSNLQRQLDPDTIGYERNIYESMHRVQKRIAEESFCLEGTVEITTAAGQETYAVPDDFIVEYKLMPAASTPLQEINLTMVDKLKRARASSDSTDTSVNNVFYYYKWGNEIGFLQANGGSPQDAQVITMYYYRQPDDTIPSDTIDLEVNSRWDTVIALGVLADLRMDAKDIQRYEMEFVRVKRTQGITQNVVHQIATNRDYD